MAKSKEKLTALGLRRKGQSVKEIAKSLGVSKGTVSVWTRDILLTKQQKKRLHERMVSLGHRGRMIGAEMNRKKKIDAIQHAKAEAIQRIGGISIRDLFMLGLGLYWGGEVRE